jgi:hypothetical protein
MNLQQLSAEQVSKEVVINENFETLDWSTVYGKNPAETSGLTWGYYGGRWGGFAVTADELALSDDATNYIVVDKSDGVPSVSSSADNWNDTENFARVYKVTTASGLVTVIEDHRAGPGGVISGAGSQGADGLPGTIADVPPSTFNARLTLESGVAVSTTDQTAKATLYLRRYKGNVVALYAPGDSPPAWIGYPLDEISVSLSGLIKGVCYDVFLWDNSGLELELVEFKKVTAGNNPAAGSNVSISLADTSTLAVGQLVTVKDGSASEIARITVVTANTSITVATLANSYTTPDVYGYRARVTGLAYQDGVLVKDGSPEKRYVGTIAINSTGGQTEDTEEKRLVDNYYNCVARKLRRAETTDQWNYSTADYRLMNNSFNNRVEVTGGVKEKMVDLQVMGNVVSSTSTVRYIGVAIGDNHTTTGSFDVGTRGNVTNVLSAAPAAFLRRSPSIGLNYYAALEYGGGTDTQTWRGDAGVPALIQAGITGTWFC